MFIFSIEQTEQSNTLGDADEAGEPLSHDEEVVPQGIMSYCI